MTKSKLYILLATACFLGYLYVGFVLLKDHYLPKADFQVCIFKNWTSYPCLTCGTTRSVKLLLLERDFYGALMMNPMGVIVVIIMAVIPVWLVFDVVTKRQSLFEKYVKTVKIISTRYVVALLIALVLLNWVWNINKQL